MNLSNEEILDALRPRMRRARVAHLRRVVAGLAVVPILGLGAVAMAADGDEPAPTEMASGGDGDRVADEPEVEFPDIGDADDEAAATDEAPDETEPATDPQEEPEPVSGSEDGADGSEERTEVLGLGELGVAEVAATDKGLELLRTDMVEGWEIHGIEIVDDKIQIIVIKGDTIKMVVISPGVRDEIQVRIVDVVIPTTTTMKPEPEPKPKPEPIVERIVVEVPERGTFVVERDGDVLWLGAVTAFDGYHHEIGKAEGYKVWVRFTNGERNWYGKALINDHGRIETHFWDEAVAPQPVYQWVTIDGVGAVKFELGPDGLIRVYKWETAECCGFFDHNGGAPAGVARVDFEGEGLLVIVEAWGTDGGEIIWEIAERSEPAA